jgi:hypothetical protein
MEAKQRRCGRKTKARRQENKFEVGKFKPHRRQIIIAFQKLITRSCKGFRSAASGPRQPRLRACAAGWEFTKRSVDLDNHKIEKLAVNL